MDRKVKRLRIPLGAIVPGGYSRQAEAFCMGEMAFRMLTVTLHSLCGRRGHRNA